MPQLITESLRACEPDLRQVLMGNVVLTGGGSLFAGFGERLNNELLRNFPHVSSPCILKFDFVPIIHINTGQDSCPW